MTKEELRAQWKVKIQDYKDSGLSMAKWCKESDNKLHQLQYWLKKYKNTDIETEIENETTTWLPVEITTDQPVISKNYINIKIGKCEIEVNDEFNKNLLKKVISVLSESC